MRGCADNLSRTDRRPAVMRRNRRAFLQALGTMVVASSCSPSIRRAYSGELGRGCPNGAHPVFGAAVRSDALRNDAAYRQAATKFCQVACRMTWARCSLVGLVPYRRSFSHWTQPAV